MVTFETQRAPWDCGREAPGTNARGPEPERWDAIELHGVYLFDPARSTSAEFKRFLHAGLRLLRSTAKARGLSDEQVHKLLLAAFERFEDAGNSIWATLQQVSKGAPSPLPPHTASEEDRLVPVDMDYQEPLTLLDPDAGLLADEA